MALITRLWSPAATKIVPLILLTIAVVSASGTTVNMNPKSSAPVMPTPTAMAIAIATGNLTVQWGDPYLPSRVSVAKGNESLTVEGNITASTTQGYYSFTDPEISGSLHVQWIANNTVYSLDGVFRESYSQYQSCTIFPTANSFVSSYMYFYGQVTTKGTSTGLRASASVLAQKPGLYSYQGSSPSTLIVIYSPSFHADQFVFRWSQSAQYIFGIEQPTAASFNQTVVTN